MVLASQVNSQLTIQRTKQQVLAIYQFDARTTLKVNLQIWLDQFKSGEEILTHRGVSQTVGPGHQVVTVALPRSVINRKCLNQAYHCSVLATGRSWAGVDSQGRGYMVDQGTNARQALVVTSPHRHPKHH